jgi:hypothetical protein
LVALWHFGLLGGCVFYSAYMPRGGAWKCTGPRMVPVLEK